MKTAQITITSKHPLCKGLRPIFLLGRAKVEELEGLKLILKHYGLKRTDFARICGYTKRSAEDFFQKRREIPTLALIKFEFEISLIRQGKSAYNTLTQTEN